ncbi:AraC family transcriptional regulator, partial [Nitratireductor sp. GCM10026969]|uniref:AraC family transcriptional regulator n=1 Tax=Nitratireductor sp. GCM10026969 TaxID=3252645 RepID=UPI003609A3F4
MLNKPDALRRFEEQRRQINNEALKIVPEEAGPRAALVTGGVVYSLRPPGSQTFDLDSSHFVAVILAPCRGFAAKFGAHEPPEADAPVGTTVVRPIGWESTLSWSSTIEKTLVSIDRHAFQELAENEFDTDDLELRPPGAPAVDPWALQLAERIKLELKQGGPFNELYLDSVVTLFGVHLLRNYVRVRKEPSVSGGLPQREAKRVQEYLAENFTRKLSVGELAALCNHSPNHFIQAFTKTFGQPPYKFLTNMRLDFAERLLVE